MNSLFDGIAKFFTWLIPNSTYPLLVAVLFLAIAVLCVLLLLKKFKDQRANFVLGIAIVGMLLLVLAARFANRWQWILGLVPTFLVGYQLFFLWLYHPKETDGLGGLRAALEQTPQISERSYKRARETISSHFSLRTLFTRYGLPAVLLGIAGIVLSDIMVNPQVAISVAQFIKPTAFDILIRGIRLGAAGAYIYVLLQLGRRTFRHDITGPVAMWCWVTLVLGPVLSATIAFLWKVSDSGPETGWWGTGVVLFFAGFAPRRVIGAIEGAATELLKIGPRSVVKTRLLPLSQIRGIGPEIEERLGEEGIMDINSLAAAEPVRLVRNTPFDMREILTWIDEAILIVTLPKSWEALEEIGITGAIDLAWYSTKVKAFEANPGAMIPPADIIDMASAAKLSPANLVDTINRLSQDMQVQYIWTLYNNFSEFLGGDGKKSDQRSEGN